MPTPPQPIVLIVDDDRPTAEVFAKMLRLEGYRVFTALTVASGLDEADAHPPDAIVLDLRMPVEDGRDFLQQLRARQSRAPVAIVTGDYFVDEALVDELQRLGAAVMFKPLWLDDLSALVANLVQARRRPEP